MSTSGDDLTATLHPDLVAVATALGDAGLVATPGATLAEARAHVDRVNAFVTRSSQPLPGELLLDIAGVPTKLYRPPDVGSPALLFYAHGGGFRQGTLAGWDAPLRQLVRESGVAVLSIDYALAPEHKFPVAFDQLLAVMRQVIADGAVAGHGVTRFAAGGDSAGANLVLGAALALRDLGIGALRYLMLLYGVYSKDLARPSWQRLGGFGLSVAAMQSVWSGYLAADEDDWRVQPLHADLTGLPSARLAVGNLDPLLDENIALAEKLRAAGVAAALDILPQVNHGVIRYSDVAPVIRALVSSQAAALRAALAPPDADAC